MTQNSKTQNPAPSTQNPAHLLISCPDQKGIVAKVSNFIFEHGGNIIQSDQHSTDYQNGRFFMRLEFSPDNFDLSPEAFHTEFSKLARQFQMDWEINYTKDIKRMALFASQETHCILDLLWRWKAGELPVDIPCIISNHETMKEVADDFNLPFHHFHITKENKSEQESKILEILQGQVDFIVLARYMQILSDSFVDQYPHKIINIHHSFLPAFAGAKPYRQAMDRGVKIIGATAHYATAVLDEGPIIEQDVIRVSHRDHLSELQAKGKDIERTVLHRAVKWHVENRVIVDGNKTIVFV
ncbi:formyltetrahydrofolate deformylase [Candidatus Margulisiibacteriota bacterium]